MKRQNGWSFVIVLIVIVSIMGSYSFVKANSEAKAEYVKIKIEQGDTLWGLSSKYKKDHTFTADAFVSWVEKNNGVQAERLKPGQMVTIPVKLDMNQIASK